jgi:hypothetical protein
MDYEKLYRILFNGITDALEAYETEGYQSAKDTLIRAQQAAEDYYIEGDGEDDCPIYVLPHDVLSKNSSIPKRLPLTRELSPAGD